MDVPREIITSGVKIVELLAVKTTIFPSKGECRRMIQNNGLLVNKKRISGADQTIGADQLINHRYILIQKGKKNYFLLKAE